jgi:anti-anti-sigma factor
MSLIARESAASGGRPELTLVRPSTDSARRVLSARAAELESFAVEMQRRDHVAIVEPRGELDLATIETLAAAVDAAIAEALRATLDGVDGTARLVLDLRGLTFIGSTGLNLLVALHRRSQHEGFKLTLLAPPAPVDRAIQLCGLDQDLPFVAAVDAV